MSRIFTLSRKGIEQLLINAEVTSKAYYEKRLLKPMWPGGHSGITIGAGYDIGMHTVSQLQKDLFGVVPQADINKLQPACMKLGILCKKLLPIDVTITWEQLVKLFYGTSLPEYTRMAASIFPELEELHPIEQTVMVGIVYNRGKSLKGDTRREMKELVQAIKDDNDVLMASLIRSMKRLWRGKGLDGLIDRYEMYADKVDDLDTPLPQEDILQIEI